MEEALPTVVEALPPMEEALPMEEEALPTEEEEADPQRESLLLHLQGPLALQARQGLQDRRGPRGPQAVLGSSLKDGSGIIS
jgi:hypothetical protein